MQIKILKTTVLDGRFVKAGEIVDASQSGAALLIGMNKAEAIIEADPPKVEPAPLTTAEIPTVETKTFPKRGKRK